VKRRIVKLKQRRLGFTLIEIVMGMAIISALTGIVFAAARMALIAERNHRRKSDLEVSLTTLQEMKENSPTRNYPLSCNNKDTATCWVKGVPTSFYKHSTGSTQKGISFANLQQLAGRSYTDDVSSTGCKSINYCHNLDPNTSAPTIDEHSTHISIRSWAKCKPDHKFTGDGASPLNAAGQVLLETFNGYILYCDDI
jgi:prepilin-type N-terminal cleavage/methylation domain-containing protein